MGPVTSESLSKMGRFPCSIVLADEAKNIDYDSIVIVASKVQKLNLSKDYSDVLTKQAQIDNSIEHSGCVLPIENTKRLIYSPTGPIDRDFDDVRRFSDAASKGIKRAIETGSKRPLLVVEPEKFKDSLVTGVLGALEALYLPLKYREEVPSKSQKIDQLGIWVDKSVNKTSFMDWIVSLESGRFISRDIGGGDPERMAPPKVAEYVKSVFEGTDVKVEILSDIKVFEKEYPLFEAVNRAASVIERHAGQIIFLTWEGQGPIERTIMPVGKGITYDTGGADIKAGGIMAGMSRDKCGAAAVAGFFQFLTLAKPKGVKAIGAMAVARNSVGENCYVSDEIIVTRNGTRVRIGNTDAEGRMVMTDVLCKIKELAVNEINPQIMTIATLTGHACLAVGPYAAIMDNGPAKEYNFSTKMQFLGESLGEMYEISTIRREDFSFIKSNADGEDLCQCNNAASSRTPRGHQFPAAFMIEAAGLEKHGINSQKPLRYTHIDIAGSSGEFPLTPTGTPILALAKYARGDTC